MIKIIQSLILNIELKIDHYVFKIHNAMETENIEVYLIELNNLEYFLTVKKDEIKAELSEYYSPKNEIGTPKELIENSSLQQKLYLSIRNNLQHRIKLLTLFGPIKQYEA